jgi:hypothetical protein
MLKLTGYTSWGTDPEGFFKRDGIIIGSEKLIPENGISVQNRGKIVRDGIQFELNPDSSYSPFALAQHIGSLLAEADRLAKQGGAELCWDGLVEVSREEINSLAPASQVLGCMPSQNVYGAPPINVDPKEYRKRSTGGHIHAGVYAGAAAFVEGVPLFDIFVGNTLVLLDRDPGAAERRENYGRAGECRFPKYGLEYRTPSNFWLRDPSLMLLTFGLADVAMTIFSLYVGGHKKEWNWLIENVNIDNFVTAINTNNWDLARANFAVLEPFLRDNLPATGFQLTRDNLDKFIRFAETVRDGGIEHYFPTETIVQRWQQLPYVPFETFLTKL